MVKQLTSMTQYINPSLFESIVLRSFYHDMLPLFTVKSGHSQDEVLLRLKSPGWRLKQQQTLGIFKVQFRHVMYKNVCVCARMRVCI